MLFKFGKEGSENCSFFMKEPETSTIFFILVPSHLDYVSSIVIYRSVRSFKSCFKSATKRKRESSNSNENETAQKLSKIIIVI